MKKEEGEAFWIKLEKFVLEFSKVDILQLRINHNFTYIDLPDCKTETFSIVSLLFSEQCFGSLAVTNPKRETDFRVYLYKE